jgi:hypothetical protein
VPIAWRTMTACGSLRPAKHTVSSIVASGLRITDTVMLGLSRSAAGWLDRSMVDRLRSLRGARESYSDVILRVAVQ